MLGNSEGSAGTAPLTPIVALAHAHRTFAAAAAAERAPLTPPSSHREYSPPDHCISALLPRIAEGMALVSSAASMLTPGAVCSTRLCCFCALCSVFVRGSSVLSTDSSASPFWDKYLEFELAQFSTPAAQEQLQLLPPPYTGTLIGGLYALVTSLPLKDVDRFWASFTQRFAAHYPLNYLASPEEAAQLTSEYPSSVPTGPDGAPLAASLTDYVNAWEAEQRAALLSKREYAFRVAVQLRDEKAMYEAAISRPYFHTARQSHLQPKRTTRQDARSVLAPGSETHVPLSCV